MYRRYPSRDALPEALTHRSFRLLVALAEEAETREGDALARLDWYWDRVIEQRDQLVLPLHGGPPVTADHVRAERARLHACLRRLLDAGRRDGSIRDDVDTHDIILFGGDARGPTARGGGLGRRRASPEGDPPRRPGATDQTVSDGVPTSRLRTWRETRHSSAFAQIMRGAPGDVPRLR